MLITELRKRASRLDKLLNENAQKPWDESLAREVLGFLEYFNMVRGEEFDSKHRRFWFAVLSKEKLQLVLGSSCRENIEETLHQISLQIAEYVLTWGKNGSFEIVCAVCDALKITHHPDL